ncbi:MAG TPA: hypothetical protein VFD05_01260 [Bacilli bacterium]|nr:hypothetical protein [Bacilli bacterium]
MGEFFKKMGRGILFIVLSPVAAIVLAFYLLFGVFLFIFMSLKSVPVFLKGGSILEPTEFDVDVEKKLISERREKAKTPEQVTQQGPTINVFIPEGYNPNTGQAPGATPVIASQGEVKEIDFVEEEDEQ